MFYDLRASVTNNDRDDSRKLMSREKNAAHRHIKSKLNSIKKHIESERTFLMSIWREMKIEDLCLFVTVFVESSSDIPRCHLF